ncbi:MAG TPA: hypothetical protein PLZ82_08110 [Smithellaceae bacterium]|nr:hypothetical protein [Smithellaceae bacterium]HQH05350.1 hypothetical protein [Smithellaceae bacterium]HQJ78566.1 hypothetical protein [Smithellaceae bacterium]
MRDRDKHVGKTYSQKKAYNRYIQNQDYEPTIDESIDFGATETSGEELSESTSKRVSRGNTKKLIAEHIKEHWVFWLFGALIIIGLYIVNESRVTTAIMGNNLTENTKSIDSVKSDLKNLDNKVNSIEKQSALNAKDIEYLKKKK